MNAHILISNLKTDYRKTLFIYTLLANQGRQLVTRQSIDIKDLYQELYGFQLDDLKNASEMYKQYKVSHRILEQLEDNKKSDARLINYLLSCCYNSYTSLKSFIPTSLTFTDRMLHLRALLDYTNYECFMLINKNKSLDRAEQIGSDIDLFVNAYDSIFNSNQWINSEDNDQLSWIINYIKSYQDRNLSTTSSAHRIMRVRAPEFKDLYRHRPSLHLGLELKEKALGVMYFFDTLRMTTQPEIAENLNLKIRKAYSQRKYRNESEGRSSSNYMLRTEVKKKLKELAKAERLKLNETIELLIEEAHKKLKN